MDPNELLKNPEQIQALIGALQVLLNQSTGEKQPIENQQKTTTAPSKPESTIKTKGRQKVKSHNIQSKQVESESINKFEQMSEFRMHKDDCNIDKKLSVVPPVARMRDFEFIDVICRVCGRTESVAPSLMFDSPSRYKCNNCSTQAG